MFKKFLIAIFPMLLLAGCIDEEGYQNSNQGNFEALWKTIDERYCFFDVAKKEFGLDWNAVHDKYKALVDTCKNEKELFAVLGDMLGELRDGHVNLISMYGTSYYWDWHLNHPMNFSDSIQRNYLGKNFKMSNGFKYTTLEDSIGYIYCESFANGLNINNLSLMLYDLKDTKALILDVRNNGGGLVTTAEKLASAFTDRKIHCGYMQHKTGPGHNDFSEPEKIYLEPSKGTIWLRPVIVLTNRSVYSAANHFVMLMKELPYVMILGDKTGGGSGLPMNNTLPNGWNVRLSACPTLDARGEQTEFGIEPDMRVDITSRDWDNGKDTIIEAAKTIFFANYNKKEGQQGE